MENKRLFVDMDGVLARFHDEENFSERMCENGFFAKLNPFDEAIEAVKQFAENPDFKVFVISSPLNENSLTEKKKWLNHFLPEIPDSNRVFLEYGQSKAECIRELKKTDVLWDDYNANLLDWTKRGGKAVLCVNDTSHLRPKGTEWSAVSVSNCDTAEIICDELNAVFDSGVEQVETLKFYNAVYPRIYPKNNFGRIDNTPIELQPSEISEYVDDLNAVAELHLSAYNERGLMQYYRKNDSVDAKVKSLFQHFEIVGSEVMFVTECDVTENLTGKEIDKLKEYLESHGEKGFGRAVSLSPVKTLTGKLYAGVWSREASYKLLTKVELEQHPELETGDKEMSMSMGV